tara:strand:+ start:10133 stop:10504 length:372 start_codon:yes stop_codon:yes gene_type:complete
MEFLVNRNYKKLSIGDTPNNEYLSVMVSPTDFENIRYGGALRVKNEAELDEGLFTYFRINPAYRERFEDPFTYCNDESTLVAYVKDNNVYILMKDASTPFLRPRDPRCFSQRQTTMSEMKVAG